MFALTSRDRVVGGAMLVCVCVVVSASNRARVRNRSIPIGVYVAYVVCLSSLYVVVYTRSIGPAPFEVARARDCFDVWFVVVCACTATIIVVGGVYSQYTFVFVMRRRAIAVVYESSALRRPD